MYPEAHILSIRNIDQSPSRKTLMLVLVLLFALYLVLSPVAFGYAGLGGYISEKTLSRTGTASSSLYLGSSTSGPVVIASVPSISTGSVTSNLVVGGSTTATLSGDLSSLNGAPQASVWFEWGYGAGALTNTTPVVAMTTTGTKTGAVTGINTGHRVYYRMVASTDGTAYGNTLNFIPGGTQGVSYWFMNTLLPIAIAAAILIFVTLATGNPIYGLIGALVGLICFVMVQIATTILF